MTRALLATRGRRDALKFPVVTERIRAVLRVYF